MKNIKHIPGKSLCLLCLLDETQKCILQHFIWKVAPLPTVTSYDYLPDGSMGRMSLQLSA